MTLLYVSLIVLTRQSTNLTIGIAITAFYFLDFSINAVQANCRALIVDVAPLEQQQLANAWGGRMIGFGNILGYFMGFLDLPALFPFLGATQLKVLCVLAIAWFLLTLFITCVSVKEIPYEAQSRHANQPWWQPMMDILHALWKLPSPVQSVCNVQFFGWLAWFPFIFYSYVF